MTCEYNCSCHLWQAQGVQADRHAWDFAVPFVGHGLSADAAILPKHSGVGARVTTLQEGDVGLTHSDVLWCRVGVQLLMPGLQELALYALKQKENVASFVSGFASQPVSFCWQPHDPAS